LGMGFALFLVNTIIVESTELTYNPPKFETTHATNQDDEQKENDNEDLTKNEPVTSTTQTPRNNYDDKFIPSPDNFFDEDQILVYRDKVQIDAEDILWASFADTKSMLPTINKDSNALQIVPNCPEDISLGDIVSYKSKYADGIIIHRVVHIDEDDQGVYFVLKGDNNPTSDPGKIRCNQIDRKVVAIIY
ncbi:MAG: signal peptidase I, partial [bacterium]